MKSNEQRVIEKIRLLFFIVNGLTCAIIKQINESEVERENIMKKYLGILCSLILVLSLTA